MNEKKTTEHTDIIMKLLQKENEALKQALMEKNKDETMTSLLSILEFQRDRLNSLEDGKNKPNK